VRCVLATLAAALALTSFASAGEGITIGQEVVLLENGPGKGLQATPDVAFGKDVYLAVWREGWHGEGGASRIYAARVDTSGKVLDPKGIEIAPSEKGVQTMPRVAFGGAPGGGGGVFLVVWQDLRNGEDYDVLGVRVSPVGKVLDAKPLAVAVTPGSQVLPDVASDGTAFLVAWQSIKGDETEFRGYAAPVSAGGKVGPAVETGATPQSRLAWDGTSYLVAWGGTSTYVRLLGRDGKRLTQEKKLTMAIRNMKAGCFSLAAAPGKGCLLIGHRSPPDYWNWGGPGAVRCALVTPEAKLAPSLVQYREKTLGKEYYYRKFKVYDDWLDMGERVKGGGMWPWGESALAWDGRNFVAVWQRHHIEQQVMFTNCDLIASRVDGWRPLDRPGAPVAATDEEEKRPALASDGAGKLLCVYERHGADGKVRIGARTLETR